MIEDAEVRVADMRKECKEIEEEVRVRRPSANRVTSILTRRRLSEKARTPKGCSRSPEN